MQQAINAEKKSYNKETTMTFRLDVNLRKQFMDIAENMNMPAAQILRALMRNFIQRNSNVNINSISEEEKEERTKAVNFAHASICLEGYSLSKKEMDHAQRFICGEIDLEKFVNGNL